MSHIVHNSPNGNNGSTALSGRGLAHRKLSLEERIGMAADLASKHCHLEPSRTQAAQLLGVTVQQLRSELKARARREVQAQEAQREEAEARASIEVEATAIHVAWYGASPAARELAVRTIGTAEVWDCLARIID
jgi:hypothetical protein